ncbi:trypsin-like peptidase domain-containing protein [Saccharopolyspora sp. K220]|uniref:nSTAND1 domain-containing NTPase n=1 Tax=Saccharopolyspora soli TaxID=2926618 RepID=UPI001F584215|nr:trypsin-like peptidase domain-containing protein [Saccharopolyspora soli]MCI2419041.1 trypsin-like peptidase domain-containing protein [Saccharopolyspora soli]
MTERPDVTAAEPLAGSVVRLVAGSSLLGTGFVLPGNLVATCAHVVAGADGITADFPLFGSGGHAVEVVEADEDSDVAILRLLDPPSAVRPAPVRLDNDVLDHRFRVLGFTAVEPDGVWVRGRIAGHQGAGRVQMAVDPHHQRIVPGFSGAPVWDERLRGVVGMVVTRSDDSTAHLVPMAFLREWVGSDRNPYLGLKPFQEADADRFHGRDAEIAELLDLLRRQDMVAIAGPSGSGKSSLVRAGLLPRLKREGVTVVESLEEAADGTVLFLDQFEEQVVADPEQGRAVLAEVIERVTEQPRRPGEPAPLRVVLTLRSRSLDDLITPDTAEQLNQSVWLVKPMRTEQLREAIERPAESAGLALEVGLLDAILHDCPPGHGTLSLLSEVLEQLWQRRQGVWLTHEAYQELGRVPGALSRRADEILDSLRPVARQQARRLLTRLTRPDGEGGHARRSANLEELDDLREIAQQLAAKRLVVVRDERVELPHQALIDHWPTLRGWLTEDADFLTWQAKLTDLQNSEGQLTAAPLVEATDWLQARPEDIPEGQRTFIRHSAAVQRRSQRRWRTITVMSLVLTLIAAGLTAVVATYAVRTNNQLRTTNAALLAQASERAAGVDPRQALQLALAAYREKPDSPDAYGALFQQRVYWHDVDRVISPDLMPDSGVRSVFASADGRVLVIYPEDWAKRPTVWWDLDGPNPRHREIPVDPANTPPAQVKLSPDGRFLAVHPQGPGTGLRLLELTNPDEPITLLERDDVSFVDFSWNSRFLSAKPVDDRQPVRVWDLATMRELPSQVTFEEIPGEDPVAEIHPSPDGRYLITKESHDLGNDEYQFPVVVRDLATGARVRTYPTGAYPDVHLLVGGGTLLVQCDATGLHAVEPLTGRTIGEMPDVQCSDVQTDLAVDLTGQYLLLDAPNVLPSEHQQIIHWPTWHRMYTRLLQASFQNLVLSARDDHQLTVIASRDAAMEVRTVTTTAAAGDYSRRAASVDKKRWAAVSDDPAGLKLVLQDDSGAVLASTIVPDTGRMPLDTTRVELSFDGTGERIALAIGPRVRTYRTAGLVLEHELQLPLPPGHVGSEMDDDTDVSMLPRPNGGLMVCVGGMLSFWDLRTGTQTSPPLVLEEFNARGGLPENPTLAARPGHPEQVLVMSGGRLAVWDVNLRKPVGEFPFIEGQAVGYPVVSTDGSAASAEWVSSPVKVIDLDTLEVRAEINADINNIIGFSDHYLFTGLGGDIRIWDLNEQRPVSGGVQLLSSYAEPAVEGAVFLPDQTPGRRNPIPLDPEEWFEHLCRFADRDFTAQEEGMLPGGVDRTRPCER